MSILLDEIYEQPAALRRVFVRNDATISAIATAMSGRDIRYVVLAARGTSDNAATYARYLFEIVAGLPAGLAAPSVHTLYEASPNYRGALVIGVSQSGAGEDINQVIADARVRGAVTAAVTNTPDSELAQTAEFVLHCDAGVERAVAATKTYTTSLALLARLIATYAGNTVLNDALERIGDVAEKYLPTLEATVPTLASTLLHAERMLTVARGLHLCTAIEASLKIAETTHTATQAFSSADLLHGPIASVPPRTPCLLFIPDGRTADTLHGVAEKLEARGARVLTLSPEGGDIALADPGSELLAPIVDILPAQLLAYHLTVARGLDPDHPRGLTKVTVTR